jgi:hypothetical protein
LFCHPTLCLSRSFLFCFENGMFLNGTYCLASCVNRVTNDSTWGRLVNVVTMIWLERCRVPFPKGKREILLHKKRAYCFWRPCNILLNGCENFFPGVKANKEWTSPLNCS